MSSDFSPPDGFIEYMHDAIDRANMSAEHVSRTVERFLGFVKKDEDALISLVSIMQAIQANPSIASFHEGLFTAYLEENFGVCSVHFIRHEHNPNGDEPEAEA